MGDFLDSFFPDPKARGGKRDQKKLSRRTIRADKYDDRTYEKALEMMPDFDTARDRLCDHLTETGNGMTGDVFHLLHKVEPGDRPNEEIRAEYLRNAVIRDHLREMPDLEELRGLGTIGDPLNAGLGFISLRPAIETVNDQLQAEQDLMDKILEEMAELAKVQKQAKPIDKQLQDLAEKIAAALQELAEAEAAAAAEEEEEDGDGGDEGDDGAGDEEDEDQPGGCGVGTPGSGKGKPGKDGAKAVAAAGAAVEALQKALAAAQAKQQMNLNSQQSLEESIASAKEEVEDGLDQKSPGIRKALEAGLQDAIESAKEMQSLAQSWGIDPGILTKLDPTERIALAKQIKDDPKLKMLAAMIGRYTRVAFAENRKQVQFARSEITDIELGQDLTRLLPQELIYMRHPVLKRDFRRRYIQRSLLQYKMEGTEKAGMGSIICEYDGSMSMAGPQEIAAKAVTIALLNLAKEQKRAFKAVQFGSPGQLAQWDFDKPEDYTPEKIFEMSSFFYNGGTDFQGPLALALGHLQEEHKRFNAIRGDIVFVTDGYCGVDPDWLKEFKDEQARLGFQVFGVVIGGDPHGEPLWEICDGHVVAWNDLSSPNDLREVFGAIHKP